MRQHGPYGDAGEEGAAEDRKHQGRPQRLDSLAEPVAEEGDQGDHAEIEGHGIQRDGGKGGNAHAEPSFLGQDAGAEFRRQVLEAAEVGGMAFFGAPADQGHADDYGGDDADGGGGHRQGADVLQPVFPEGVTQGCRRAVASAEAGGHAEADGPVDRPDPGEDETAQQPAESPLQEHAGLGVGPHPAHLATTRLPAGRGQGQATEDQGDQDAGVTAHLVGKRQPAQQAGTEDQSGKTGQQARRDEQPLEEGQFRPGEFPEQEQAGNDTGVDDERPGREGHGYRRLRTSPIHCRKSTSQEASSRASLSGWN